MDNDWYNDGEWKCNDCDVIFKSYALGDVNNVNFCPYCGSRDLSYPDEDDN